MDTQPLNQPETTQTQVEPHGWESPFALLPAGKNENTSPRVIGSLGPPVAYFSRGCPLPAKQVGEKGHRAPNIQANPAKMKPTNTPLVKKKDKHISKSEIDSLDNPTGGTLKWVVNFTYQPKWDQSGAIGFWCTCKPKWDPKTVLTTTAISPSQWFNEKPKLVGKKLKSSHPLEKCTEENI